MRHLLILALGLSLSIPALADEIIFTNGDRLTGRILSAEGGKLTIQTDVAGTVTVDLDKVKTFSTDEPITLKLRDGTVLSDRINPGEDREIALEGTGVVQAQPLPIDQIQQVNPPPVRWTGAVTAGGLLTRGNSDAESLHISFDATRRTDDDRISFAAGYFFARQRSPGPDTTTTDNWFVVGKYDYFVDEQLYVYGLTRIERDRIAALDLRLSPGVGVGYQWWERPDSSFATEAGLSWVYEDFRTDGSDNHLAARLAYRYDRRLTDTVTLFHTLEFLPNLEDLDDFNLNVDIGARAALTASMFAELKAIWRRDESPAPGAKRNDFRYLLSIGWTF